MELTSSQPDRTGADFAGSTPTFPALPGATLQTGLRLPNFQSKRLIFNRLGQPGQVHVYAAECRAGERLRVQMLVPMLPAGGSVVPAFAVVAQSLPYSADMQKLPFTAPAGFSSVVATPPAQLTAPAKDVLTRVRYYLGPAIDTRTLIGGRAYIVVWSPHNHLGKAWGKPKLAGTPTAKAGVAVRVELKHRYALDGRDPNSYSGIFWCLGHYGRPWAPERPIFGVIRYMSSENTKRKLKMKGYLARYSRAPRQAALLGLG